MKLKRIPLFLATVTCFALILASCGKTACKPVSIDQNFKCHADISQGEATYSADLERGADNAWKTVFTEPETIKGMELTLSNDSCSIQFNGLSYSASKKELPQFGVANLVTSSLEQCIKGKAKCFKNNDTITQEGQVNDLDFKAEFIKGKLKTLEIGNDITVKIK